MASGRGSPGSDVSGEADYGARSPDDIEYLSGSRVPTEQRRRSNSSLLGLTKSRSELGCYGRCTGSTAAATDSTNLTLRGGVVGLLIGVIICFSNTYFGLQTGWVSGMAMPASLIGFGVFQAVSKRLTLPFTPVENVFVQTVAGAVGTMPLGCGFVGVIPALEFLLKKREGAPIELGLGRLMLWSVGVCLFGVVFAVPLRKEVIIREKLKFPSGTATALMIGVLHGTIVHEDNGKAAGHAGEESHALLGQEQDEEASQTAQRRSIKSFSTHSESDWKAQIRLLSIAVLISASYTLFQYFVPQIRHIPILGPTIASTWLWTLNPSPAYVGQGIIMGTATTVHMLIGAIVGWGILSPIAKHRGYAPGPTSDWESGSRGWIVWLSLAIMLADAIVNLSWLLLKPLLQRVPVWLKYATEQFAVSTIPARFLPKRLRSPYEAVRSDFPIPGSDTSIYLRQDNHADTSVTTKENDDEAPPHHLVSLRTIIITLPLTLLFCVGCIQAAFGSYIPISLAVLSTLLAVLLSVMGVRALGETDLNPVSGISKLTQLVFALLVPPPSSKHHNHAIIINLVAGAVSESGALQAGDMMQDLKAGHLIGASPKAQFYGQAIGSVVGAIVSAAAYKIYVHVYRVPGDLFQVPTAYVWIFTARLVTGQGLPPMAGQYALIAGAITALLTCIRIYLAEQSESGPWKKLHGYVPGGIAVAVGMYNTPSFTLARTIGGLVSWWWIHRMGSAGAKIGINASGTDGETKVIILASGLILGEGIMSIFNLGLASLTIPHF